MNEELSFEEKIAELEDLQSLVPFHLRYASYESLTQMIKANELKYIEHVLEAEEELKLVQVNIDDFKNLPEEVQRKAITEYPKALADPDYFTRENADRNLIKPTQILANIENKKNEAKIKNWQVEYRSRLIDRLKYFRKLAPQNKKLNFFSRLFSN